MHFLFPKIGYESMNRFVRVPRTYYIVMGNDKMIKNASSDLKQCLPNLVDLSRYFDIPGLELLMVHCSDFGEVNGRSLKTPSPVQNACCTSDGIITKLNVYLHKLVVHILYSLLRLFLCSTANHTARKFKFLANLIT